MNRQHSSGTHIFECMDGWCACLHPAPSTYAPPSPSLPRRQPSDLFTPFFQNPVTTTHHATNRPLQDYYRKDRDLRRHRNLTAATKQAFRDYLLVGKQKRDEVLRSFEVGMNHRQLLSTDSFLGCPPTTGSNGGDDSNDNSKQKLLREDVSNWDFPRVSRILRYEHLEDDMRLLLGELGVPPEALPSPPSQQQQQQQQLRGAAAGTKANRRRWELSWSESVLNRVGKKLLHSATSAEFSDNRYVGGTLARDVGTPLSSSGGAIVCLAVATRPA